MIDRRAILKLAAGLAGGPLTYGRFARAAQPLPAAPPAQPFDFAWLKGQAHWLASSAYQPPKDALPPAMAKLSYDQYQAIRFRGDHALWGDAGLEFRLQFFHVGRNFTAPVHLYEVIDGQSREIIYDPAMFDWEKSGVDPALMKDYMGFAGFRVQFVTNWQADVAAFLGASYFRAVGGDTRQYGLSARALAIDTAFPRPEEFPRFTSFWFERPGKDSGVLTLYALLDSPSIAGAMRFQIAPGGTQVMNIDTALYPRTPIERLGLAPLTSMFFYGKNDRRAANDWRPEVHDSDGVSMWTGAGEWIWRPLINPAQLHFNSYLDDNPRGFGLLQRDRNFDHYQDDGVYYDRRPSLWVEPKPNHPTGGWGKGAVQLVEIPTADETSDNIVVFWNPLDKPKPGQELLFSYRLYWGTKLPYSSPLGETIATRTGIGGTLGVKRQYFSWHFGVDFAGGELGALAKDAAVEAVVTTSHGQTEHVTAHYVAEFNGYRALFDVKPTDDSAEPIDLRMYLRLAGRPLTETWIYQWTPPSVKERKLAIQ
jgi:periplasmic glucans biosynthesis protein